MSHISWDSRRQSSRRSFKTAALRLPGQSTDEQIRFLESRIDDVLVPVFGWVVVAAYGGIQLWVGKPLHPAIVTLTAIVTSLWAWKTIRPFKAELRQLRMGRDGDRVVGQLLEPLRSEGYRVFHDIPGEGFNIDHAIIGPAGIFTIDTKTRSKLAAGRPEMVYDGNTVCLQHAVPDEWPIVQARAQASWLSEILSDARPTRVKVRPVVVVPEWYVERTGTRSKDDVWVLTPEALESFLDHVPGRLSPDEIQLAATCLTSYCRSAEPALAATAAS